jgi:hypothetical protein
MVMKRVPKLAGALTLTLTLAGAALSQLLPRIGSSSGDDSLKCLRRNGKKGTKGCKEGFMCDLKGQ